MNQLFLFSFVLLCTFYGCITDYDGAIPSSPSIPVLNGILYTDSAFSFDLTWSNDLKENEFEGIKNASILLKKNGTQINPNITINSAGKYISDDTCKNGDTYAIELSIPDYVKKVSAETSMPIKATITCNEVKEQPYSHPFYQLNVDNIDEDIHAIYVFLFLQEVNANDEKNWVQRSLYCNSPSADPFNRFFDPMAPDGFSYEYDAFLRFPTDNLIGDSLVTKLTFNGGGNLTRFYILSATKEYDLYFKGGYLQRSFDPEIDLPFTYQPIFLPNNIVNGAGIFAGIDVKKFDF